MFNENPKSQLDLANLAGGLFSGDIKEPLVMLRHQVVKKAREMSLRALKRDNLHVLSEIASCTRRFCLENWTSPNLVALYVIWDELVAKMETLNLILEPLYNGQNGIKTSDLRVSNDWTYHASNQLTETQMVVFSTFHNIFLVSGTEQNAQINRLLVRGLCSYWTNPIAECCWVKFETFCHQFELVHGGEVISLSQKRNIIVQSIVQFHRTNHTLDGILVAVKSVDTLGLAEADREHVVKTLLRVNTPHIVELLGQNVQTSLFNQVLRYYNLYGWDLEDFDMAVESYVVQMLPSFDGVNERSAKSITQLISKCLEVGVAITEQFEAKEKYHQAMKRGFGAFQRSFAFHLSKYTVGEIKSTTKVINRNDMEVQWEKFMRELSPLLETFTSIERSTFTKTLVPPLTNILLYEYPQYSEAVQFNIKDCMLSLGQLLGQENQLEHTVKQIMDGYEQLRLFRMEYPQLQGDIICCKTNNEFDEIKDLPKLEALNIPRQVRDPLEAFVKFNGKRETYWDVKRFRFQLQFGDAVIHCNYVQFETLMKFNERDTIPHSELDAQTMIPIVSAGLVVETSTTYTLNQDVSGVLRLK